MKIKHLFKLISLFIIIIGNYFVINYTMNITKEEYFNNISGIFLTLFFIIDAFIIIGIITFIIIALRDYLDNNGDKRITFKNIFKR